MFMFRSKRTVLARRLWRARARRDSNSSGNSDLLHPQASAAASPSLGSVDAAATLLRRLRAPQLEALLVAVESRGADAAACVLLRRAAAEQPPPPPHLLCCQTWRWPDLCSSAELKRLPMCSAGDATTVCVNPYHWSRLCAPECPPPPYCRVEASATPASCGAVDQSRGGARSTTVPSSMATGGGGSGDPSSSSGGGVWCRLAYWELAARVGRLFAVEAPAVDVFGAATRGNGLCLAALTDAPAAHTPVAGGGDVEGGANVNAKSPCAAAYAAPEAVRRTRAKIGLGVTLSCEADGVWAYNRSDGPIFVNSPTLDDAESRTLIVYRVPPGHCLNIFEDAKVEEARRRRRQWEQLTQSGPTDPNSVRISFAKGWGPKYSRQEVTACPCWLEVLLAPCR